MEPLRELAGVWVDQPGGAGGLSSIYIRGADPNFTLVLIDGVRVNDSTNARGGSFDVSTIMPEAIERIEVVRGVRSAAYGSDALAGVVNFVTASGATSRTSAEAAFGTEGYRRINAQLAGSISQGSLAVTAGTTDYGEPESGNRLTVEHATARIDSDRDGTRLAAFGRFAATEASSYPEDSGGVRYAATRELEQRDAQEFSGGASIEHALSDTTTLDFRIDGSRRDEQVVSPGVAPGQRDPFGIPANHFDSNYTTMTAASAIRVAVHPELRAVAGIEWRREEGVSDSVLLLGDFEMPGQFDLERTLGAAFAEFEWKPVRKLALDGALRIDDAEGWESQISPSAAVRYQLEWLGATAFVRWGEGFKLPSFFALGNPLVGNPRLRPETSEVIEAGVRIEPASCCSLEFAAFSNRYRDLIDFDSGPPPRLVNRSAVKTRGIESTLRAQVSSRIGFSAQATFVETDVVGSGQELRNRPEWRTNAAVTVAATEELGMSLHVLYVGEMYDSSIPTGDVVLDGFSQADLVATWTPSSQWRLQFALDNLADEHYEQRIGVPAPGRGARASVRFAF